MLIEIFSDKVYEETTCDPKHGIKSKRAPSTQISERGPIGDYYLKARDFLVAALDTPYFAISTGGSYMLEIECDDPEFKSNTSITPPAYISEHKFSFKFNSLRDTMDNDKASTIHGEVIIDKLFNVISFKRDRVPAYATNNATCTYTQKVVTDSTSTSGKRTEWVKIEEESNHPFDSGCQQEEPCDDTKGAGSDATGESESIELSKNSFSVKGSEITVKDPELKIGTVDGRSFSIDAEKQKMQDEFLANMSRKISKRNRRRGTK